MRASTDAIILLIIGLTLRILFFAAMIYTARALYFAAEKNCGSGIVGCAGRLYRNLDKEFNNGAK